MSNVLFDARSNFEDGIAYCEAIVMHLVLHDLGNQRTIHGLFVNDSTVQTCGFTVIYTELFDLTPFIPALFGWRELRGVDVVW